MTRILIGLVAAIVIAVAGFFGFQLYTQRQAAAQIEAMFEQIRSTGAKASHGQVTFSLLKRTVTVADIEGETAAQPPVSVKIGSFTASGVSQPDATHVSADSVEADDIEVGAGMAAPAGFHISYKAPRITVKDYFGPLSLPQRPASSSIIDLYRFGLEQFAGISASSISVPSLAGTLDMRAAAPVGSEFTYSDFAIEGIKGGKIATMRCAAFDFTVNTQQAGKTETLNGKLVNLVSSDIDATAMAAILDPQNANDDNYHRAYRQVSTGAYTIVSGQGPHLRMEGMTIDDVGLRPSRLQIPALLAMLPVPGATPTPAQTRDMIEKLAGLYEGIRIGGIEIRGMSVDTPQGAVKLAATRLNLDNGKSDFAVEGFDAASPKGPVRVGRFALKSLDIANSLRILTLFSNPAQKPPPDQALRLLTVLGGVEVKGVVAPFKDTGRPVTIDNISLDWGQFVGPIPTKAHLIAKMTTPVDATDPTQKPLVAAGLDTLAIDGDLGAAWTETAKSFALDPVTIDIAGVAKASARVLLANVPRGVFSPNVQQAAAMAAQIEAGTLEVTLRDTGGVDLFVKQYARTQNVSADDARRAISDKIKASSASPTNSTANPDAVAIVDALARFVETPRQTLTLKLTPRAHVPALQLVQLLKTQPVDALAQFQVEVATGP